MKRIRKINRNGDMLLASRQLKIKTIGIVMAVVLMIVVAAVFSMTRYTMHAVHDMGTTWKAFDQDFTTKMRALSDLQGAMGYGGLIHDFKNVVPHGDLGQIAKMRGELRRFALGLSAYRAQELTKGEGDALTAIENTVLKYQAAIAVVERMNAAGAKPMDIDRALRIDDSAALDAFVYLDSALRAARTSRVQGVYDAVAHANSRLVTAEVVIGSSLAGLTAFILWFTWIRMAGPLINLNRAMHALARGDHAIDVPAIDKHDEIGDMARSVLVFRENAALRSRAEQAMRESEAMLRDLTANLPGIVYQRRLHADGKTSYPFISSGVRDLYGYEPEEITEDPSLFLDAIPPGDRETFEVAIRQSAETMSPLRWEGQVVARDKRVRWVQVIAEPRPCDDGSVLWHSMIHDISARKQAEEALNRNIALMAAIKSAIVEAYAATDVRAAIRIGVDCICHLTGWPVGHAYLLAQAGQEKAHIWRLEDPDEVVTLVRATEALRLAPNVDLPGRILAEKRAITIANVAADPGIPRAEAIAESQLTTCFGLPVIVQDEIIAILEFFSPDAIEVDDDILQMITTFAIQLGRRLDQLRMDAALRHSETRFRNFATAASDWFWETDADLRYTWFSERFAESSGLAPEALIAKTPVECLQAMLNGEPPRVFNERLEARAPFQNVEITIRGADDKAQQYWSLSGVPVFDEDGIFGGYRGTGTNITDRIDAVEHAAATGRLLEHTIDNMSDGMSVMDADLNVVWFNDRFLELLDFPKGKFKRGDNLEIFFRFNAERGEYGDGDPNTLVAERLELARRFEAHVLERTRSDGTALEIRGTPLPDGGFVTLYRDVTDRYRVERVLRASERRLAKTFDMAGDAIIVMDSKHRVTLFNRSAEDMFGYAASEVVGKSLDILLPDSVVADHRRYVDKFARSPNNPKGVTSRLSVIARRKDGTEFSAALSISKPELEGEVLFTGVLRDITEQLLIEADIRKSAHQQKNVAELGQYALGQSDLLAIMDRAVDLVSDTLDVEFVEILELLPGGETCLLRAGRGWREGLVGQATVGTAAESQAGFTLMNSAPVIVEDLQYETRFLDPPLLREHGIVSGMSTVIPGHKEPLGVFGVHTTEKRLFTEADVDFLQSVANVVSLAWERKRSVSQRSELERELLQAQKLESLGTLAGGIAHEINTPVQYVGDNIRFLKESFSELTGILRKYEALSEATSTPDMLTAAVAEAGAAAKTADMEFLAEEIPASIEQSIEGIDRISEIVRAIKEFSHPDAKERKAVDIAHAIMTTVTIARNQWKYVAEVEQDFDPALPPILCLPGEFNQVILNLIVNAAHAIEETQSESKGRIVIRTRKLDDWVRIEISDTGAGIPEDIRDKIFDPFFTTKEPGKGTGQGLAITHTIVTKKHGGTISVESETGNGTTFIISLPLSPDDPAEAAA